MKHSFISLLCALFMTSLTSAGQSKSVRIAVASDVHVMAPSLLVSEGEAYAEYMKNDRKLLKESPALLDALTARMIDEHPDFVFLTGDLTKDGELESHRYLVEHCLKKLAAAGIAAYVIPGNHDVNNPHAEHFDGSKAERVETVSPKTFSEIYADYGYGKAVARDTASLSYVFQLTPTLRVLALDACKYYLNDFDKNECRHDGVLKEATIRFAEEQIAKAHAEGMHIIGMMHHGLMEHWKYQNRVLPGYVIDNSKDVCKRLRKSGLRVVFTGHLHAQDIVSDGNGLYDVETGSLVSYPSPYRVAVLDEETLQLEGKRIHSIAYDTKGVSYADYAREHTAEGFRTIISRMFPGNVPDSLRAEAVEVITDAMCDNYAGDEHLTPQRDEQIKRVKKALRKYTFKRSLIFNAVARSLWSDLNTKDNNLTISPFDKK